MNARCRKSGKKKIPRWEANLMLRNLKAPRVYRCPSCHYWHITSKPIFAVPTGDKP